MANISINLSSSVISHINSGGQPSTLADAFSLPFMAAYGFYNNHPYYSSMSRVGNDLRLNYADGAHTLYSNVVLANPNASSGTATATNLEQYFPSYYRLTINGALDFSYMANANGTSIDGNGGTIYAAAVQTLLPSYSASYDAYLGNVTLGIQGNLQLSDAGNVSGVITSLTGSADKNLVSSTLTGNFNVSGNSLNIAQNLGTLGVSGTATSYTEKYSDGSSISLANLAIQVNGDSVLNQSLLANPDNLSGDDVIDIALGATPSSAWLIASGAGNDRISIKGAGSALSVNAGTGNDVITLGDHGHSVDGGAGMDTAIFSGARSGYSITQTSGGYSVHALTGGTDLLSNVERLQFSDSTVALDVSGNAGQVYRLYQAAFNRVPDSGGLGYWIKVADSGTSLDDIARNFASSKEFTDLYGANPSNAAFLDALYHNVLHRAGDQGGFDWWLGHLNAGDTTQAQVLAQFGESAENQAALIGTIGNGFSYTPYG